MTHPRPAPANPRKAPRGPAPSETGRATPNLLEDFHDERSLLQDALQANLNILDDFTQDRTYVQEAQRATLNILEDLQAERAQSELHSQELAAVNKELETFAYSVSHDLRAPLRAIDGFSQALLEEYRDKLDDQGKDYLDRVRNASQRMAKLIDDLLNLSRLTRKEMVREPVDLAAMARTILADLARSAPTRPCDWTIEEGLVAEGDPVLLRVVLENLLGNAWKFTRKVARPTIGVGREMRQGKWTFYVRDNGSGFDMADAEKLFQPFQRLHRPDEFEGTGIGLASAQRIIHRHGGRIWAEAKVNAGATFYFTL